MLIYLHIPKTGGTTLNEIAFQEYFGCEMFLVDNGKVAESTNEVCSWPEDLKSGLKFLSGHFAFGVHERFKQDCKYIAVMRDPLERAISHYYYVDRFEGHYRHKRLQEIKEGRSVSEAFREYIFGIQSPELDNAQVRQITGMKFDFGECTEEHLDKAKENIDNHFAYVGTLDNFDAMLGFLRREYKWKTRQYEKVNVTNEKKGVDNIDDIVLNEVRELNKYDEELFKYVKERFKVD
jgi:hypothetical protein